MVLDDFGIAYFPGDMKFGLDTVEASNSEDVPSPLDQTGGSEQENRPRKLQRQRSRHISDPSEEDLSNVPLVERCTSDPDLLGSCEIDAQRKTLRLSKEQLDEINLVPGENSITFSITTKFQGTARLPCPLVPCSSILS